MKVAVLIPCYNEELTIGKVIDDFKHELPESDIYVYDNNSTDKTKVIATEKGVHVVEERRQGKGNVVRSMFFDIDADYYIMVDGDDTYPAEAARDLLEPLINGEADMTIGDRLSNGAYEDENKRAFHNFGNNLVRNLINRLYKSNINDIMTGYRGFNKLFVRSFPIASAGYEIETEMSIHSLDKRFKVKELPIDYRDRPSGSESKLNTFSDGFKVIKTIFTLFKDYKPLEFFSIWAGFLTLLGLIAGVPVILEFLRFHYIYKVPSAILAVGLVMMAMLSLVCGLILDTVVNNARKQYEVDLHQIHESLKREREQVMKG
ncbi:glycosyltransferase family 2 protein [Sporolactobacillus pectinivorans]|uniref:glycosyltransferase family 2 protein n=1 Tax=Sporolactobacillus pectinivorans TaxID=1591408 RepID=UPI000C264BFC|nr:glycosyltransferase family 2 protein [Sporolactobacillus pectinivorans]